MKKITIGLIIIVISIAFISLDAAPGDVVITFTIPAAKVADFQAGFLAKCPIPLIEDPLSTPENPLPLIKEFTPKQWIKEWIKRDVKRAYRYGKKLLAEEAAVIDPNIVDNW